MEFDLPDQERAFGLRAVPARKKLCAALAFSVAVALLSRPLPAFAACVFAGLLLWRSGLSPSFIARRLVPVNVFFLFLWLLLPLSFAPAPETALRFGPVSLNASGAALALLITLKGNAIAAALLALAQESGKAAAKEPVLVVAHAGVNRVLLARAAGLPLHELLSIPQPYGALSSLRYSAGKIEIGTLP